MNQHTFDAIVPEVCLSVITPVCNTDPEVLIRCIESVRAQRYRNWELCICDDSSDRADTRETLASYHGIDPRIRILRSPSRLHISGSSNMAATLATGAFVSFLDHDDELHPTALEEIAQAVTEFPDIDLLYTDEDKIDFDGSRCEPYFKPDWSPEHLQSVMYILHVLTVRKRLFWELGGFRDEYAGAQDYDLALRASRRARRIHHIPKILYHWRKVAGSASAEVDAKPYALTAGQRALQDYVNSGEHPGTVEPGKLPGLFRVRYALPADATVTALILSNDPVREIPGRGEVRLLQNTVQSIRKTSTFADLRLLVVHGGELSDETKRVLKECEAADVAFSPAKPFNYAQRTNFGMRQITTDFAILLNDDVEVITPDWVESLIEWAQRPGVGAVGARLYYPDKSVQHAGLGLLPDLGATHAFYKLGEQDIGYYGFTHLVRNYAAVTAAVLGLRTETFHAVGGFDERFAVDFNDVDFCLRLYRAGYRIVYTPFCELTHFEGSSLKRTSQNEREVALFKARWHKLLARDPYLPLQCIREAAPGSA